MLVARLFRIRKDQDDFLRSLPGEDVAYVRLALDDYIEKIKKSRLSSSASNKGGE